VITIAPLLRSQFGGSSNLLWILEPFFLKIHMQSSYLNQAVITGMAAMMAAIAATTVNPNIQYD
jgi:hypothetical protein